MPGRHGVAGSQPEGPAGGQLVGVPATVGVADGAAAQHPDGPGAGDAFGQGGEGHERRQGRVAGTDDRGAPAAVAGDVDGVGRRRVGGVGDEVGDASGDVGVVLAVGGVAVAAERVRTRPGARRVDDGPGAEAGRRARTVVDVHREGLGVAAGVHDAVAAGPGDAGDGVAVADPFAECVGQRLEVEPGPFGTGGVVVGVGGDPPGGFEQSAGGGVDELGPAREQAHVAPLGHGGARVAPTLEDHRVEALLEQVGGSCEPDRTGADDDGARIGGRRGVHGGGHG